MKSKALRVLAVGGILVLILLGMMLVTGCTAYTGNAGGAG